MPPARYGPREGDVKADVVEGSRVRCVYCPEGIVRIDLVETGGYFDFETGEPAVPGADPENPNDVWCEGTCTNPACGLRNEFDYQPWVVNDKEPADA